MAKRYGYTNQDEDRREKILETVTDLFISEIEAINRRSGLKLSWNRTTIMAGVKTALKDLI